MQATRRPLTSRDTRWAAAIARFLSCRGIRPNVISVASAFFAGAAGICLWLARDTTEVSAPWFLIAAAVLIQLRLLCNLFDGMVAIEGGFKTRSGEIFNELPDRFADAFIFIGAGHSMTSSQWMPWVGWLCAALAILTAYVRALGAYAGAGQQFCGPMAKPQRMAAMTVACMAAAVLIWLRIQVAIMPYVLGLIALGCIITVFRRTRRIIAKLESQ